MSAFLQRLPLPLVLLLGVAVPAWDARAAEITPEGRDLFEAKIRPVLIAECYECHAGTKSKGGLLLDSRDNMLQGGNSGDLLAPGDPEKTLFIQSLAHTNEDEDLHMPKNGAKLDKAIVQDFIQWVKMGAPDPRDTAAPVEAGPAGWDQVFGLRKQWWAFQPLQKASVDGAGKNPVDAFIQTKLTEQGLAPAPPAAPRILERRLAYALTGLPPLVADLKDEPFTDEAWAARVDKYLASPAYGETWARHWMDLMRYAETHGSEGDPEIPFAWRYRDYLVRAFNNDVPYGRFVQEHIAGDLITPRWNDQTGINESVLATANLRLVEHGFQPVDSLDEQVKTVDNQIDVLTKAFLGLTVSCARCHDHKFDAISQKDYYALYGILASTRPGQVILDRPEKLELHKDELIRLKGQIKNGLAKAWLKAADKIPERLKEKPATDGLFKLGKERIAMRDAMRARVLRSRGLHVAETTLAQPVASWSFEKDASDSQGNLPGELVGGAVVREGRLVLDGKEAHMRSAPLQKELKAKTLEAWVLLANITQRGGGVVTVENGKGHVFDSIVFAEKNSREWLPGSDNGKRTQTLGGPAETATPKELVHLCLTCGVNDLVTLYRNGVPYGDTYKSREPMAVFEAGDAHVLLGRRHTGGGNSFLTGEIEEARLYDRALRADEVAASFKAGVATVSENDLLAAMTAGEKQQYEQLNATVARLKAAPLSPEARMNAQWAQALRESASDTTSPLMPIVELRSRGVSFAPGWEVMIKEWRTDLESRAKWNAEHYTTLWDVSGSDYDVWYRQGTGLSVKPSAAGEFVVETEGDTLVKAVLPAGVYSDLLSSKHGAVLTSPRFKMDADAISLELAGHAGGGVRIIVDNYPIGDNATYPQFRPERDALQWTKLDTTYRKGSHAYLEFATYDDSTRPQRPEGKKAEEDSALAGRSSFGVSRIVLHKDTMEAPKKEVLPVSVLLRGSAPPDEAALEQRLIKELKTAVTAWQENKLTAEQQAFLDYFVSKHLLPVQEDMLPEVAVLTKQYRKQEAEVPVARRAPGPIEADGFDAPLLVRGDHHAPDAAVQRTFLSVFGSASCESKGSGRRELAEAMTQGENPLVARVMVNRIWHWLFGRGLVPTVDNFGRLGDKPTHPELLDHLAVRFVKDGHSVKKMVRLILTSHAWRMSSEPSALAREKDPDNQWLSHFRVRRLDAEAIRDAMLLVSGKLDPAMEGASVPGNDKPRRSLYLKVKRTNLNPFMEVFDTPKPFTTVGRRDVTNVPAQSLTMLNDPFVINTAERWAQRVLEENPDAATTERIRSMFEQAFARRPDAQEMQRAQEYLQMLSQGRPASDPAAWRDLAQSLFNLKEFIYLR